MRRGAAAAGGLLATLAGPRTPSRLHRQRTGAEKSPGAQCGLGWIGKHTNLIARDAGSYFFLGEIYTDLELPLDEPAARIAGPAARACPPARPAPLSPPWSSTRAAAFPTLTIELHGPIPEPLRPALGNRIYGCDDCQRGVPLEQVSQRGGAPGFQGTPRIRRTAPQRTVWLERGAVRSAHAWLRRYSDRLCALAAQHCRRVGATRPARRKVLAALEARRDDPSELVREHVHWALRRHGRAAG